jgi:hypothetical protein
MGSELDNIVEPLAKLPGILAAAGSKMVAKTKRGYGQKP